MTWYTFAYNKGLGGGILPPFPRTNNKIATPPEVERMLEELEEEANKPLPPEMRGLHDKLEELHTNGMLPIPASALQGENFPAAIQDQYDTTTIREIDVPPSTKGK